MYDACSKVEGVAVSLQLIQDIQIGARASRTQYQYTLIDADKEELSKWSPKVVEKLKSLPIMEGVASDQTAGGLMADLVINRDEASRMGVSAQTIDDTLYDAFGQRQISTIYQQLNQYHVVMEVTGDFQLSPENLDKIYVPTANGTQSQALVDRHASRAARPRWRSTIRRSFRR